MKKIWNWIKNIFKPERQDPHLVMYEEVENEYTDKEKPLRDKQMGGSKYLRGGGIAQRGLGRAFMKGGRVR